MPLTNPAAAFAISALIFARNPPMSPPGERDRASYAKRRLVRAEYNIALRCGAGGGVAVKFGRGACGVAVGLESGCDLLKAIVMFTSSSAVSISENGLLHIVGLVRGPE